MLLALIYTQAHYADTPRAATQSTRPRSRCVSYFFTLFSMFATVKCPVLPYLSSYLRSNLKTNINLTLKQLAGVAHDVIFRLLDN